MDRTVQTVTSWGDAIFLALSGALFDILGFVPRLLGALVILFVGWLVSRLVEGLVTRGLTEGRYTVDHGLEKPERGNILERYVFELSYRGKTVTLQLKEGHVREEFIIVSRKPDRTPAEEERRRTAVGLIEVVPGFGIDNWWGPSAAVEAAAAILI